MAETTNTETTQPKAGRRRSAEDAAAELFAEPEILNGADSELHNAHDLTTEVDPEFAGVYELTVGMVRIGKRVFRCAQYEVVRHPKTGLEQRGAKVSDGAKMRLGAIDAYRMLQAGVVRRIDGKRPDKIEPPAPTPEA